MDHKLKPIRPKRISDQVLEQIRELIFRGELKPGSQIMPERELAAAMAVSRTAIRDAINKLVAMGLLEHKQGQGTFVLSPRERSGNPLASAMEAQNASLDHLLEVRMGLECNSAAMAARRAQEKDLRFMKKNLEEMEEEIRAGRTGTGADIAFHMAIAFATQNPVQVTLMRSFYDLLTFGIKENLFLLMYEDPASLSVIFTHHREIFAGIESRDPEQAFRAMHRHITHVIEFLQQRR